MRMGDVLIRARDVTCVRGGRMLFGALDLALGHGEAIVVTGANGSGKSSLLRVLAGLLAPSAGTVERPVPIAYLGHDNALKPDRTLGAELGWWATTDGSIPGALDAALGAMNLTALSGVPVRVLSAGQARRAALARVMASGAALWLLDEPGAGLDAASAAALSDAIGIHLARGGGVIAASHGETAVPGARVLAL